MPWSVISTPHRAGYSVARSLYGVLGVSPLAGEGEIKAAFRKLAKQFHPDLHAGDKRAEQRFKEINEAHARLSDPHARATYDASLSQERSLKRQRFRNAAAIMATTFVLAVTLISTAMVWRQHENGLLLRSADRLSTKSLTNQGRRAVAVLEDETTSVEGNRAEPLALPSSERHIETSTAAQTSIESTLVDTRSPNLGDVNSVERAFRSDARLQESERPAPAGGRLTMSDGGRSTEEVTQTQAAAPEASRAGRTALAPALPLGKDAANWAIYRNTHFGFALGYPADIFVADPKQSDENVRRFVSREAGRSCRFWDAQTCVKGHWFRYRTVLIEERYANAKLGYYTHHCATRGLCCPAWPET